MLASYFLTYPANTPHMSHYRSFWGVFLVTIYVTNYLLCRNSVQQYFFKGSCRLTQAFEIALRNRATVFTARTEESAEQQYLISSHLCGKKVRLRRQTMSSNRLKENGKCDFGGVSHWPPANLRSLTNLNTLQLHFLVRLQPFLETEFAQLYNFDKKDHIML